MILFLGLLALLLLPAAGQAQTYSRCIDANGRIHLTDSPAPPGIRCVAQVTKELEDTPPPAEKVGASTGGQHALWLTEQSGVLLLRTYPTGAACDAARDLRVATAPQRSSLDITYRCLPAGAKP